MFMTVVYLLAVLGSTQAYYPCGILGDKCKSDCDVNEKISLNVCTGGDVCCIFNKDYVPTTTQPTTLEMTTETKPPPAPSCGYRSLMQKILNAPISKACMWPWKVSIRGRTNDTEPVSWENSSPVCQGVLISEQYVLTTGVCVLLTIFGKSGATEDNLMVIPGEQNTAILDIDGTSLLERFHKVETVIFRSGFQGTPTAIPDFQSGQLADNNLVIIKLAESVEIGSCRFPVCLTEDADTTEPWLSKNCVIATWGQNTPGFGQSSELRNSDITLYSSDACKLFSSTVPAETSCGRFANQVNNNAICNGDNGGMVVCKDANTHLWKLFGLVSVPVFSGEDCRPADGKPVQFADVNSAEVKQWITDNTT